MAKQSTVVKKVQNKFNSYENQITINCNYKIIAPEGSGAIKLWQKHFKITFYITSSSFSYWQQSEVDLGATKIACPNGEAPKNYNIIYKRIYIILYKKLKC